MAIRRLVFATLLLTLPLACRAGELIRADFGSGKLGPWVRPGTEVRVEGGVAKTAAQAGWQRNGLDVGPLPLKGNKWVIAYDFRPVKFGAQCQEFVSQTPSTHWYMCYVRQDGKLNLHTRAGGKWEGRGTSPVAVEVGKWYHMQVTLGATSLRFVLQTQDKTQTLWDTGEVAVDDLGQETTFSLVDEAPDAGGQTEWDNLTLATDSPAVEAEMGRLLKELEAQQAREAQLKATSEGLRRAGVALVPMPQSVVLAKGTWALRSGLTISADAGRAREGAVRVQAVIKERLNLVLKVGSGGTIRLRVPPSRGKIPWQGDQGYQLEVGESGAVLTASTPEGFFYAAQTLCQLAINPAKVPACRIVDWPDIPQRLVMIAVSQGGFQVIDPEYWKRLVRELAAVKINYIMPYDEGGSFTYESAPFLGVKGQDGFTLEKSRLLSAYAKEHFIELVPQQEMLGHMGSVLTHEELKDIREAGAGDVVCSSNPKTFEFLGGLMDDLCRMFPDAKYLHVGGDEFGHNFAKCPLCKAKADQIGKPALYAEHMMKLREMCRARKRDMMIWWHEEGFTDEAADKLAKDIVIFDWHYGNQASYPTLEKLQGEGFAQTWATPAVTRYYGGRNDWDETFGNISGFLAAGARRKVPGECTCTWVHGIWGGRNLFELNLYGVAFSGNCAWNSAARDYGDFRWRFARHWFGLPASDKLDEEMLQAYHAPYGDGKEQKFWRDNRFMEETLAPPLRKTAEEIAKRPELVAEAHELEAFCDRQADILTRWRQAATRNDVTVKYLGLDTLIHGTTCQRLLVTDQLLKLQAEAKTADAATMKPKIEAALAELKDLVASYQAIERGFAASILEAGGGRCGTGGWFPYIATGGVIFRAPQGRAEVEKQIAYLEKALQAEKLPAELFGP